MKDDPTSNEVTINSDSEEALFLRLYKKQFENLSYCYESIFTLKLETSLGGDVILSHRNLIDEEQFHKLIDDVESIYLREDVQKEIMQRSKLYTLIKGGMNGDDDIIICSDEIVSKEKE
jgi:hypothetical protein